MRAAGVNFVDGLFVQGKYQIKPPLPFTPGGEVAGDVVAVGEGVDRVAVGDRVLAMPWLGGYASPRGAGRRRRRPDPRRLSYGQAAALVQSYGTMLFSFTRRTQLQAGRVGARARRRRGIGLAAIDVARHLGARVIAAASSEDKLAAAAAAGAEATIAYETEDLKARARELSGGGVDVVVDPVGDRFADPALRALGWMGRYLVIGFAGGEIPRLPGQPGAAQQPHPGRRRLGRVDDARPGRQPGPAGRADGAGRLRRAPPGRAAPSTRSTTSCGASPTCRTARWPARSSSSPERRRRAARQAPAVQVLVLGDEREAELLVAAGPRERRSPASGPRWRRRRPSSTRAVARRGAWSHLAEHGRRQHVVVRGAHHGEPPEVDGRAHPQVVAEEHVAGEPVAVDERDLAGLLGAGRGEDRRDPRVQVVERTGGEHRAGPLELQREALGQEVAPPLGPAAAPR